MAWTNNNLSRVTDKTEELMKDRPDLRDDIEARISAARQTANDFMTKLQDAGLTTYRTSDDGKELLNRAEISVTLDKDGKTLYTSFMINDDGDKFVANLRANGEISSIQAEKWNNKAGRTETYRGADEIAASPFKASVKNIAAFVMENGLVADKSYGNSLESFCVEANKAFKEANNVVSNDKGEYVNDAYAKYINDDYGEKVELRSHTDPSVVVELKNTSEGKPFAVAMNFDLSEELDPNGNFKPRNDGEKPAKVFINNKSDLAEYIKLPEIQDVVAKFKGFDGKEKSAKKDKGEVER